MKYSIAEIVVIWILTLILAIGISHNITRIYVNDYWEKDCVRRGHGIYIHQLNNDKLEFAWSTLD